MTDKLYIIGNGFDQHHGLNTSYANFRNYVRRRNAGVWKLLCEIYGEKLYDDMWWNNFEERLGKVDYNSLAKSPNGNALGFSKVKNLLKSQLPIFFGNWISKLPRNIEKDPKLDIDTTAFFFTFNYTMTLEELYNVPTENIWHIHRSLNDFRRGINPIVGHDSNAGQLLSFYIKQRELAPNIFPTFADNINRELANGAKKVKEIIQESKQRFYQYTDIKHFFIMGFSMNNIDMPYIQEIINVNKNIASAEWTVYWYADSEDEIMRNKLLNLGINEEQIRLTKW